MCPHRSPAALWLSPGCSALIQFCHCLQSATTSQVCALDTTCQHCLDLVSAKILHMAVHQLHVPNYCQLSSFRAPVVLLLLATCSYSVHHQICLATPKGSHLTSCFSWFVARLQRSEPDALPCSPPPPESPPPPDSSPPPPRCRHCTAPLCIHSVFGACCWQSAFMFWKLYACVVQSTATNHHYVSAQHDHERSCNHHGSAEHHHSDT